MVDGASEISAGADKAVASDAVAVAMDVVDYLGVGLLQELGDGAGGEVDYCLI